MVTRFSCMASRSAACTLAGARLTSSARSRLANTGPSRGSNSRLSGSQMLVPVRSAGSRSGVNCTRLSLRPSAWATVVSVRVLARPGTPSSNTWPPVSRPMRIRSTICFWPTMTLPTSRLTSSTKPLSALIRALSSWMSTGSLTVGAPLAGAGVAGSAAGAAGVALVSLVVVILVFLGTQPGRSTRVFCSGFPDLGQAPPLHLLRAEPTRVAALPSSPRRSLCFQPARTSWCSDFLAAPSRPPRTSTSS